ncbi:MAG: metal-dependent hydrolase [Planctomycetota bacterium]
MSVELTWLGHATWHLKTGEHQLIIDPFLTENPSASVSPDDIEAQYVLLTHGHFDHVADAAAIAKRCDAQLIAIYEIATWFAEKHAVKNTLEMNLGGGVDLPFGRVTMTIAHHSSQLPDGSYGGNPAGFIIETEGKRLYFAGDTALFTDMSLIAREGLDLAVLPIGDLFTMGVRDSVEACKLLNASKVVPGHYNTWPPIEQDAAAWAELVRSHSQSEPIVPEVGKAILL